MNSIGTMQSFCDLTIHMGDFKRSIGGPWRDDKVLSVNWITVKADFG